jgi:hypothetical protein
MFIAAIIVAKPFISDHSIKLKIQVNQRFLRNRKRAAKFDPSVKKAKNLTSKIAKRSQSRKNAE